MKIESSRKIYRSNKDYILWGVCAGLADYFEIDPTLVRIIFIILAFGGGAGIFIYIILALIMPTEQNRKNDYSEKEIEVEKIERKEKKETKKVSFLGIALLVVGGLLLWNQFSPIKIQSEIFWPTVMIALGLWLTLKG